MGAQLLLLHQASHPFLPTAHTLNLELVVDARAAVTSKAVLVDGANRLAQFPILLLLATLRSLGPGIVATSRDTQNSAHLLHLELALVLLDELVSYGSCCEKIPTAFFEISRSRRNTSFSRRS